MPDTQRHYSSAHSRVPRTQILSNGRYAAMMTDRPWSVSAHAKDIWTSPEWDGSQGEATPSNPTNGYPYECATVEPFYIQAAAWSPDDSTVYISTTGYHPNGWPVGGTPRNGLCDAAAA